MQLTSRFIVVSFLAPSSFVIRSNLPQSLSSLFLFDLSLRIWCLCSLVSCCFEAFFDLKIFFAQEKLIWYIVTCFETYIGKKLHCCNLEKNWDYLFRALIFNYLLGLVIPGDLRIFVLKCLAGNVKKKNIKV